MWDMMLGVYTSEEGDDRSGGGWWMKVFFAADRRRIAVLSSDGRPQANPGVIGNNGEEERVKFGGEGDFRNLHLCRILLSK